MADGEDFGAKLREVVSSRHPSARRIGVELGSIKTSLASFVGMAGDTARWVNATGLVEQLRRVKSQAELGYLRAAGRIVAAACRDGFEALHDSMTDTELATVVTGSLIRHGSDWIAQMPNVCAGPRTART